MLIFIVFLLCKSVSALILDHWCSNGDCKLCSSLIVNDCVVSRIDNIDPQIQIECTFVTIWFNLQCARSLHSKIDLGCVTELLRTTLVRKVWRLALTHFIVRIIHRFNFILKDCTWYGVVDSANSWVYLNEWCETTQVNIGILVSWACTCSELAILVLWLRPLDAKGFTNWTVRLYICIRWVIITPYWP